MRSSSSSARRLGDLPVLVQHVPRAQCDVLQRRQMREQLEMLEYHADPAAIGAERDACAPGPSADQFPPEVLLAARRLDQQVQAAQQCRLARAARPDDAHLVAPGDAEVDPVQHLRPAEALVQAGTPATAWRTPGLERVQPQPSPGRGSILPPTLPARRSAQHRLHAGTAAHPAFEDGDHPGQRHRDPDIEQDHRPDDQRYVPAAVHLVLRAIQNLRSADRRRQCGGLQ